MSDHADIVREGLCLLFHAGQNCGCDKCAVVRARIAALDALEAEIRSLNEQVVGAVDLLEGAVAERDELRRSGLTDLTETARKLEAAEAERDEWQTRSVDISDAVGSAVARAEAAEVERDEARERGNTWHDHFEEVNSQLKIKQVECDDVTARAVAAEAEVARLEGENYELSCKHGDVMAGCDIQRGDKLYRQVEVVIGPGKTEDQTRRRSSAGHLPCWLFGHDWERREWHVLGTCNRCGKKEAGS